LVAISVDTGGVAALIRGAVAVVAEPLVWGRSGKQLSARIILQREWLSPSGTHWFLHPVCATARFAIDARASIVRALEKNMLTMVD
jgi:hypothetical protein